jgi:hypothetical protein
MLKELGVHPNRVHYHVIPYQEPREPMPGEPEPMLPEVDFEHIEHKEHLTMAMAVLSDHMLKGN